MRDLILEKETCQKSYIFLLLLAMHTGDDSHPKHTTSFQTGIPRMFPLCCPQILHLLVSISHPSHWLFLQ